MIICLFSKKFRILVKKRLRVLLGNRKHPLTGGAEALTGRQTALRSEASRGRVAHITEVDEAGRAKEDWRILLILSLRYLKIRYLKRYVGGLVHSMNE